MSTSNPRDQILPPQVIPTSATPEPTNVALQEDFVVTVTSSEQITLAKAATPAIDVLAFRLQFTPGTPPTVTATFLDGPWEDDPSHFRGGKKHSAGQAKFKQGAVQNDWEVLLIAASNGGWTATVVRTKDKS